LRQRSDRRSEDDGIAGVIWPESVSTASPARFRESLVVEPHDDLSRLQRRAAALPSRSAACDTDSLSQPGSDEAIGRIARCVRNYLNIASGFDRNQ
jgi:hypothetical protein